MILTRAASAVWSSLSALARFLVRAGVLRATRLPSRVVSVGNIQVGGAGKTPLVAVLANEALQKGLRVCILCRGYGGGWEDTGGVIDHSSGRVNTVECGDEAALLHDLAPGAVIGVGANRVKQYQEVSDKTGRPDLVILDDGFQHWKIKKDVEIVALTSMTPSKVLFRDSFRALRYSDLLVWTKGEQRPPVALDDSMARIRYRLDSPDRSSSGGPHWLVTGVADGVSVQQLAVKAGYQIVRHISFADHARYADAIVNELIESSLKAGVRIALTGKDWVKWREILAARPSVLSLISVLEPQVEWVEGREFWNRVLWER